MAPRNARKIRSLFGALMVLSLVLGAGPLSSPAAQAVAAPITFTLAAVDLDRDRPIETVRAGETFSYTASIGCPDSDGCGPATLAITFPDAVTFQKQSFHSTPGTTHEFEPSTTEGVAGGGTLTVRWSALDGTAVLFLPAQIDAEVGVNLDGSEQAVSGMLNAGSGEDAATVTNSASVTLQVFEKPGITGAAVAWSNQALIKDSAAQVELVSTATAAANAVSSLRFESPGEAPKGTGFLGADEAFNLQKVMLNQNPGGAQLTFALAGGESETRSLVPGSLEAAAPEDAVAYTIIVSGIPGSAAGTVTQRTVTVTAAYQLREHRRGGGPIIGSGASSQGVRAAAVISNTVMKAAPGEQPSVSAAEFADLTISAVPASVSHGLTWVTASGDNTSVYESGETSQVAVQVANTGVPGLRDVAIELLAGKSSTYFEYQELLSRPEVSFPKGAAGATIQYRYTGSGGKEVVGEPHEFGPGEDVPGPEVDPGTRTLDRVSGITVTFLAAPQSVIVGGCEIDSQCAGKVVLHSSLREAKQSNGGPIAAPPGNPGETLVTVSAQLRANTVDGGSITEKGDTATIRLVKPQLDVSLDKRLGASDGSGRVVDPLTGIASAGDLYDPDAAGHGLRDHPFFLVAETAPSVNATEKTGAKQLRVADPQVAPTLKNLATNPFDTVMFTHLAPTAVECVDANGSPVGSATHHRVWVLDEVEDPQTVKVMDLEPGMNLERVIGYEMSVTPTDPSGRFPARVACTSAPGTTVKFREHRISDDEAVHPGMPGTEDSAGLIVENVAELQTGINLPTALGRDSLALLSRAGEGLHKGFAPKAARYGVQGESSATAFQLSGVPTGNDSTLTRLTDGSFSGGKLVPGNSFDVFSFVNAREARVGPDQAMTITFLDSTGNPIGPKGSVTASTRIGQTQLSAADIENSQSENYQKFQRTARTINWGGSWGPGEKQKVAGVQAEVTRSDPSQALQEYGVFSMVLDVTLRSVFLSDATQKVAGSPDGTRPGGGHYYNEASSRSKRGEWTAPTTQRVDYQVFAATGLYADASAAWSDATSPNDMYLVAKHQTRSHITLSAANKTAVGTMVPAAEQWKTPDSVSIGIEQLSAAVGDRVDRTKNPLVITDFVEITQMTWPLRNGADAGENNQQRRVAGTIIYDFSDGEVEEVAAPVGARLTALQPTKRSASEVVGITVTWAEDGKTIAATRPDADNSGQLRLRADLRDTVRAGYTYEFMRGTPKELSAGDEIDGAVQEGKDTNTQIAVAQLDYRGELSGLAPAEGRAASNEVAIDVAKNSVAVGAAVSNGNVLYRDREDRRQVAWTVTNKNTGNIPVSSQRIATDKELLSGAKWPSGTPEGYVVKPGSMFDAFDVTGVTLAFPRGAATARVWALGEDGTWSSAIELGSPMQVPTLPEAGPGPTAWSQVIGVRVQFDGDESVRQRIEKQAGAAVTLHTELREHLRSDPTKRAPGTNLPHEQATWAVDLTGAGTSYVGAPGESLEPNAEATARKLVYPGTPAPKVSKFLGQWQAGQPMPPSSIPGNPGAWVEFYIVLENRTAATSDLYGLSLVDTLPDGLEYNPASENRTWRVVDAPARFTAPQLKLGAEDPATMRWEWKPGDVLKPGERVQVAVPLQVRDGLAVGTQVTNTARLTGSGIAGSPVQSVCAASDSPDPSCTAQAHIHVLRLDSVRAESYVDATVGGASTLTGEQCDVGVNADWKDGQWVRPPCVVDTTVGETTKYRLKLINSGNSALSELRFVDELPGVGDQGVVLDWPRGSEWTPRLVPGSLRLLTGAAAIDLGARGDGQVVGDALRYTTDADPCQLHPDADAGSDTLTCAQHDAEWDVASPTLPRAVGGDISFPGTAKLQGGEYVLVEFELAVPKTGLDPQVAWNSVAATGRLTPHGYWLPAAESPKMAVRTSDSEAEVTLNLANGPATRWHLGASRYDIDLQCTPSGHQPEVRRTVQLDGIPTLTGASSVTVSGLPRGSVCAVTDEVYKPSGGTAPGHYGRASTSPSGYRFTTEPAGTITLGDDPADRHIHVTNHFAEAGLDLGVDVEGSAAGMIPRDIEFPVAMDCRFGGIREGFGPYAFPAGSSQHASGLPVGASCGPTLTDALGASRVSATFDQAVTPLTEQRAMHLSELDPGDHSARFIATFEAGADVHVVKRVELPREGLAAGDVAFEVRCELGGSALELGAQSTLRHSFAPGEREAVLPLRGIPAGASCTVHESVTGGADSPAPDRTVTVLPQEDVYVEMVNTYSPAELELTKRLDGPGAREERVPASFDLRTTCTRELTVGGRLRTVTDFDGETAVVPGAPTTVGALVAGSTCTVTEPDLAGAESVRMASRTGTSPVGSHAAETAVVTLPGPDASGAAVTAAVEATNTYAATEGLRSTGARSGLVVGLCALLLMGLGGAALALRRRHVRNADHE